MSTMTLEVAGSDAGPAAVLLSASGINKFVICENRWLLSQLRPAEERDRIAKSEALDLGTLMHRLKAAWRQNRPWQAEWFVALVEAVGPEAGYKLSVAGEIEETKGWEAPSEFLRARKIMGAWCDVYGATMAEDTGLPQGTELVAVELPFDLPVPGVPGARVRGFLDSLYSMPGADGNRTHRRLVIGEDKTMGRWGRETQVPWDPQLHLYGWAAKKLHPSVDGALFDAMSTYDYKTGGPERRFKRIALYFDQRVLDRTVEDLQRVARRAKAITKNPSLAVRSVGDACTYCDFFKQCLTPWDL